MVTANQNSANLENNFAEIRDSMKEIIRESMKELLKELKCSMNETFKQVMEKLDDLRISNERALNRISELKTTLPDDEEIEAAADGSKGNGDRNVVQTEIGDLNAQIHQVFNQLNHPKVNFLPIHDFSSPKLVASTVERMFDKSPERDGYIPTLSPKPPDECGSSPYISRTMRFRNAPVLSIMNPSWLILPFDPGGEINQKYGDSGFEPIVFVNGLVSTSYKVAYYAISECCVVIAVMDGMNLVPYKYTMSKQGNPEISKVMGLDREEISRKSVIIVSKFIGYSPFHSGAIWVNPWNIDSVCGVMNLAITMLEHDKQMRHDKHYKYMSSHVVAYWDKSFDHDLERACMEHYIKRCWGIGFGLGFRVVALGLNFRRFSAEHIVSAYNKSSSELTLLDYDGTMLPQGSVDKTPSSEVISLLNILCSDPKNVVFIASGKGNESLCKWFSPCGKLGLSTEHGYFIRWTEDCQWESIMSAVNFEWKKMVMERATAYAIRTFSSSGNFAFVSSVLSRNLQAFVGSRKIVGVLYKANEYASMNPNSLGCEENALGIREWLESQGHHEKVTNDKEGPVYVTAERIKKVKKLQRLLTDEIGSDHVDLKATAVAALIMAKFTGSNVVSVAEDKLMRILILVCKFLSEHHQVINGEWNVAGIAQRAYDLEGKIVGTVGARRIGRLLLQRLKPFNCNLLYHDRMKMDPELKNQTGTEERGLVVDVEGFNKAISEAKERSRNAQNKQIGKIMAMDADATSALWNRGIAMTNDIFKFTWENHRSVMKAIYTRSEFLEDAVAGDEVGIVLETTSFYAEQGGQIFDTGVLEGPFGTFQVSNVQTFGAFIVHIGYFIEESDSFAVGGRVNCKVDYNRQDLVSKGEIPNGSRKGVPYIARKDNIVACATLFVGDGGTTKGINENNTLMDMHGLLNIHKPAYYDPIIKGISTIMVSYSSWNNKRMHANRNLITGFLKEAAGFGLCLADGLCLISPLRARVF